MPFALMNSVRVQLTLSILLAILVSWMVSGVMSYLVFRQHVIELRRQMLANPALYPAPIPEPRFRLVDLLLGTQPLMPNGPMRRRNRAMDNPRPPADAPWQADTPPPPPDRPPWGQPGFRRTPDRPTPNDPLPPRRQDPPRNTVAGMLILRGVLALALAFIGGTLLARRFTHPLQALADGAAAFHGGHYRHRIPLQGTDEFARVGATMNDMARQVAGQIHRLEEDAQRRRQMLADVAHELRGPVMTLRTMAGALEEGVADDPERRTRAVRSLARTSDRLMHLVTDLLELARLDLHELPLRRQPVDVRELAEACLQAHADIARQAGVALLPIAPGPPVMADADPDRLAQVLDNLLNNAISYAGAGAQVRVTVQEGKPVRLIIADSGRGIAKEHLPYLFDPFYRVDNTRSPREGHSGLGLRITRGLVEAHGGTLTLESAEGRGTAVTITLPAATSP